MAPTERLAGADAALHTISRCQLAPSLRRLGWSASWFWRVLVHSWKWGWMTFLPLVLFEAMWRISLKCFPFSILAASETVGEAFQWKSRGSQIGVHTFGHCLIGPLTFLHFQGSLFPLVLVGQSCSNPAAHTWDSPLSRPNKHNMKTLQCVKTMISLFLSARFCSSDWHWYQKNTSVSADTDRMHVCRNHLAWKPAFRESQKVILQINIIEFKKRRWSGCRPWCQKHQSNGRSASTVATWFLISWGWYIFI